MSYIGIDYGHGSTNLDRETGIRYGVISQHSISQAWCDSAEPDYGKPTCPKCGGEVKDDWDGDLPRYAHGCADFACETCGHTLDSSDCFSDEPQGWSYEGDGYSLVDCLDSDVMVLKSPYYTYAQFCSPCVPGAGNLDTPLADGVKTYCLGPEWFDDEVAPYPIFNVEG